MMNKTVVLLYGTNRVGKTTTSDMLLELALPGSEEQCRGGAVKLRGGVGGEFTMAVVHADMNHAPLRIVIGQVRGLLKEADVVVAEGMYIHSCGEYCRQILLAGEKALIAYLYCSGEELYRRSAARPLRNGDFGEIMRNQRACLNAVKKFHAMGVPVLSFDTGKFGQKHIAEMILQKIYTL